MHIADAQRIMFDDILPPQMHTGATTAGVVGSKMPRWVGFVVEFLLSFTRWVRSVVQFLLRFTWWVGSVVLF